MNQVFEQLKTEMDIAKSQQNLEHFRDVAKRFCLTEKDISAVVNIKYEYSLKLQSGEEICGSLRSWDQSGPFSIQPDKNVIEIKIMNNGAVVEQYGVSWED